MKIVLIGATGRTGREVLPRAISRGHHVTAVVRSTGQIESNDSLTVTCDDVLDADFLATVVCGDDVIISSLARGSQRRTILTDATAAMLVALNQMAEKPRYMVVSQGLLFATNNPAIHLLRRFLQATVADSVGMEVQIRSSNIDWTIARPLG